MEELILIELLAIYICFGFWAGWICLDEQLKSKLELEVKDIASALIISLFGFVGFIFVLTYKKYGVNRIQNKIQRKL